MISKIYYDTKLITRDSFSQEIRYLYRALAYDLCKVDIDKCPLSYTRINYENLSFELTHSDQCATSCKLVLQINFGVFIYQNFKLV